MSLEGAAIAALDFKCLDNVTFTCPVAGRLKISHDLLAGWQTVLMTDIRVRVAA